MTRRRFVAVAIICGALAASTAAGARPLAGKWIVFSASPDGSAAAQLYKVQSDGTSATQITKGALPATDPDFAPDGTQVVFVRLGVGIFTVNLDGTGIHRLTRGHRDSFPVWSPDGTRIAFLRPTSTSWNVYLIAPSGKGLHRLRVPSSGRPTWAAKTSLYLPTASGLLQANATTGRVQKLYPATAELATSQAVTVSPNGKTMTFVAERPPGGAADCGESPCQRFGLYWLPTSKTAKKELANGSGPAGWSRDGTQIAFVAGGALNVASPSGAGRKPIASGPEVAQGDAPPAWQP